jgi:hypothetical protein
VGIRFNLQPGTAGTGGGEYDVTPAPLPTNPAARRRVSVVYGDTLGTNTGGALFTKAGKYVFQNSAPATMMAYHELQFIKAEAAFRKGNKDLAYTSYLAGINAHFDFTNAYASIAGTPLITAAQRDQYLTTAAVKQNPGALTLTDIMLQKYIGDWAWNPYETWADIRRYHYFDLDPETNDKVYKTFDIPFYNINNLGPKPVYRFLPTFNSEFDWNEQEIRKIGGYNQDYHTYEMWFTQP